MERIRFVLDVEDGWPPVSIENVWCERAESGYVLVNAPFFIKGIAFGDRFVAEQMPSAGVSLSSQLWSIQGIAGLGART